MGDKATFGLDVNSREGVAALLAFARANEIAAKESEHLEKQTHQTSRGLSAMAASFGGNLMANAAGQIAGAAKDIFTSSLQITVARDTMSKAFGALLGDARKAEEAMTLIRKASTKPGLTFDAAAAGVAQFLGTGESLEMSVRLVTAFGNAAALSGVGVEEMSEAMRQWRQVIGRGKAEQEEMNSLLERFPSLGKELAKQFGGQTAEAINKSSKSVADMQNKFAAAMEGMKKAPDGLANALLVLQDNYNQLKATFGKGLLGDESEKQVNKLAKALRDLKPVAKEVGDWIRSQLTGFADEISGSAAVEKYTTRKEQFQYGLKRDFGGLIQLAHERRLAEQYRPPAENDLLGAMVSGLTGGKDILADAAKFTEGGGSGLSAKPVNPANAAQVKSAQQLADEHARQIKEARADYIRRLRAAVEMADNGQMDLINKLGSGNQPWFTGGLSGAKAALSRAEMLQAEAESPGATAEMALSQLKDRLRAEQEVAREKVSNAEAAANYFKADLDNLEQSGAGYAELAAAIDRVAAAERNLNEVRQAADMLGASPVAQGTARLESQKEDLRIRREASERLLRAGQSTLGNQAEIAGMRAELALTPVEEAMWIDRQISALRQKAAALAGVAGQEKEHLQTMLAIRRLEDSERGKLTRGQELLHASLGGGQGIARWAKAHDGTYGEIGDTGPSFDWSRLTGTKNYRGDVVGGGVLGDVQGGIVAGMAEAASPLARAVAQATVRGMENVTRAVGVG